MRKHTAFLVVAALFAAFIRIPNLHAQPLVNIETVAVGDPGNAADTSGYGAVGDVFNIGKYEVTISQYTTFLNSVASVTSDSYIINLWDSAMTSDLNVAGISRSGSGTLASPYSYSVIGSGNRPIAYVGWYDAARFANWMHNGATNGASTETGAYTLDGAEVGARTKNPGATWALPTENQWYKAAYYKGGGRRAGYWDYPTQSDTVPSNMIGGEPNQANYMDGLYAVTQWSIISSSQNYLTDVGAFSNSASAYGTYDQGGSLWEWLDEEITDPYRGNYGMRGGSWNSPERHLKFSGKFMPTWPSNMVGFRLATVPEPSTYALLAMTAAGALWLARRRREVAGRVAEKPFQEQ